jgi:hypothetical protein
VEGTLKIGDIVFNGESVFRVEGAGAVEGTLLDLYSKESASGPFGPMRESSQEPGRGVDVLPVVKSFVRCVPQSKDELERFARLVC